MTEIEKDERFTRALRVRHYLKMKNLPVDFHPRVKLAKKIPRLFSAI